MAMGVARALPSAGFTRGDRVAILSANRAEFVAAYFGIMRAGFVAVPVNYRFPRKTIHFILRERRREAPVLRSREPRGLPGRSAGRRVRRRRATRASTASSIPASSRPWSRSTDEPAMFLYTSGSTGTAQGRRALAPEPHLGGGDAACARPRPASLSDRGAALSHERAGAAKLACAAHATDRAAAALRGEAPTSRRSATIARPGSPRCRR